jgi:hypothetical protein
MEGTIGEWLSSEPAGQLSVDTEKAAVLAIDWSPAGAMLMRLQKPHRTLVHEIHFS